MKRGIKLLIGLALILAAPSVAVAARSSIDWVNLSGTVYIQPNFPSGMDLLIYGSNHYINFGTVTSSSGYGFRDNGGTMEFKNSGGSWTGIGTGVGGGGGTDGNWVFFNNSGIKLATTTNQVVIGETATTTTSTVEVNGDITVKGGIVATASSTFVSTTTQFGILMPVGALMVGLNTATTSGGAISLAKAFSAIGNANPNVGTSSGLMIYNTTDQSTNYERGELGWDNNIFRIRAVANGGGTARQISLGTKSRAFVIDESGAGAGYFYSYTNSTGSTASAVGIKTTRTNTSANAVELGIAPTYNNSSTAGYAALQIKPTETTLGSGTNYLAEMGTSTNADLFTVDNAGNASTTKLFGAMLATCNSASSALTWSAGTFGCNSITASAGGSGSVSTSSVPVIGNLAYWTTTTATPALLANVATTSIAFSGPFSGVSALGALVGGSNSTVTWTGLATTTQPASSNLLVSNGAAGVYAVATSTLTATSPLTGSLTQVGSGGALGIQAASAGQNGYLASTDYSLLHTATTTFSAPLTYTASTNAVTCSTCIAWPWTVATNFATSTQSTTTPAWYKLGMMASSTSQFDNSSTTLATIFNTLYVGAGTGTGTSTASFAGGVNKTWVMGSYGSTQTGNGSFFIASSTSVGSILSNQYFSIDQSGNVGIGTTTPIGRIHISAGANATSTATLGELGLSTSKACVNLQTSAGTAGFLYLNGAGTVVSGLGSC